LYWDEVGERQLLGSEMVQYTKEKVAYIRKRMLNAESQQKIYAGKHRHKLEFEVGHLSLPQGVTYERSNPFWQERQAQSKVSWTLPSVETCECSGIQGRFAS
jgi:hypothetical protein